MKSGVLLYNIDIVPNYGDEYSSEMMDKIKKQGGNEVVPCIFDVNGAYNIEFKLLMQHLASRISTRKQIPYSIIINRMRTHLISSLYKYNTLMILDCVKL